MALFLLLLLVVAGTGCSAATIRARVLDAQTREPIARAVVLGVWTTVSGGLLYHHELVGVRETETDGNGRFELERLPSSGLNGEGDGQAITVYKAGYIAWSNIYLFQPAKLRENQTIPENIFLERFPPGASHARHRDFISSATGGRNNPKTTPKFWKALHPGASTP
jgi:hypothetical protein